MSPLAQTPRPQAARATKSHLLSVVDTGLVSKLGSVVKNTGRKATLAGVLAVGAVGLCADKARGAPIDIYPGNPADVQALMNIANPGDTVNVHSGTYTKPVGSAYNLMSGASGNLIHYVFDSAVFNGLNDGGAIFRIAQAASGETISGYMNISGTVTLNNENKGFVISTTPFEQITISGVTFNVSGYGVAYEDVHNTAHPPWGERADIAVSNCTMNGGSKLIKHAESGNENEESPYASAVNNTVSNLSNFMMDFPLAVIPGGESIIPLGGRDGEIAGNTLIGEDITLVDVYTTFHSPKNNFYTDDSPNPYLSYAYDTQDPEYPKAIQVGVADLKGNVILYDGDANKDKKVTFTDYQILERNFGRSGSWEQGDFDNNGFVNFTDYQALEREFGKVVGVPEPATVSLIALGAGFFLTERRKLGDSN